MDKLTTGEVSALDRTADDLWTGCARAIRPQLPDATWRTWFDAVRPVASDGERLVLAVPSTLVRDRIESRYHDLIQETLTNTSGSVYDVVLEVHTAGPAPDDLFPDASRATVTTEPSGGGRAGAAEPEPDRPGTLEADVALDPRYTFEAFVIGASNRFAHAAALSVAETPARSYNPLFIYGASGLGKTHLLHAIGHYVRENFPGQLVRYVTTETFLNEFVDAIRTNTTTAFKRRYRQCDVLLVDDIQFIENKERFQEEFFHTFNWLHGANRQIVISSDRPPKSIATLEDRLRNRFEWGLITDVQPPELETRLAILRKKAEGQHLQVPDDVLEFIATHIRSNIRELEGALIRVTAFSNLNREPLTLAVAERVLADTLSRNEPRQITPQVILTAVAEMFNFSIDDLCGRSRRRPLVIARQIGMYVFRELTDYSYPMIAREFGGRDHTTVIHAVDKITGQMKERRVIYDQVTDLITKIRTNA